MIIWQAFQIDHLFYIAGKWESRLVYRIQQHFLEDSDEEENRTRIPPTVISVISGAITVFFGTFVVSSLIALFWLFRFVFPLLYIVYSIWFGCVSTLEVYHAIVSNNIFTLNAIGILSHIPGITITIIYLVLYIAFIYVVGRLYTRFIFNNENPS